MKLTTQQLEDALKESRNNAAEAAQSAKDALTQVNTLCNMIDALVKDNARLSTENSSLGLRIDALQRQIMTNSVSAGATPRANSGNNPNSSRSFAAHITVDMHTIRFNLGVQQLVANKNWRFVQFYETDVAHVIECKFSETPDIQCVSLVKNGTSINVNSVDAVNAVFGGVKIGAPTKFYSAAKKSGTNDTIYIWPDTLAFVMGKITPTTNKVIVVNSAANSQKISCCTGRMRINKGVFKQIMFTGSELFVTITPATNPDEYEMKFSSTQTPGSYVLTPCKSAAVPYELCNIAALRTVGYDPSVFKTYTFDTEYISNDTILLTRLNCVRR